jgi:DNA-binding MarR family transcriptional regulator
MKVQNDELMPAIWCLLKLAVHKYNGSVTGEVLVVITVILLDRAGYNPTVGELTEMTGLPKSNISRYLADQFKLGHLTEVIDPSDRRRRTLAPTELGKAEQTWLADQMSNMVKASKSGTDLPETMAGFAT